MDPGLRRDDGGLGLKSAPFGGSPLFLVYKAKYFLTQPYSIRLRSFHNTPASVDPSMYREYRYCICWVGVSLQIKASI